MATKKETKKSGDNLDKLFKKVDTLARTVDEMHVNVSGIATAIIDMEKDLDDFNADLNELERISDRIRKRMGI